MVRKALILAGLMLLILSCPKVPKLFITGSPSLVHIQVRDTVRVIPEPSGTYVLLISDPIFRTATVKVNDRTLKHDLEFKPDLFHDPADPRARTEYKLKVETDLGKAEATCKVPGEFRFSPPLPDSVALNAALTIRWRKAADANWYMVDVSYDTKYQRPTYKETTKVVTDTSFVIPERWLDKDGRLCVHIYAANGPERKAGVKGNVKGDAKGFWIGSNAVVSCVRVGRGIPGLSQKELLPYDNRELLKKYLESIAPENADAREILRMMR